MVNLSPIQKKIETILKKEDEQTEKYNIICNNIDGILDIEVRALPSDTQEIYAQLKITQEGEIIDPYNMEDPEWIKKRTEQPMDTEGAHPSKQLETIKYCRELMQD